MTQQSKRRKKRYQPGSAYAGDVKPTGFFGAFANVRFFFIIGAAIMVGSVVAGGICSINQANTTTSPSGDDFVKPDDEDGTGTPGARPTVTVKQYTTAPALTIDPAKTYVATIKTAEGDMQVELLASEVPQTVNNFVFLANDGFYNGLVFHQVSPGFNAQVGDPNCQAEAGVSCTGRGDPGYELPQENPGEFTVGTIGMANGSQFFIALDDSGQFNEFTPFGRITSGLDVAERIVKGTEITAIEISSQ